MRGELRAASEYLPAVPCTRTYVPLEILLTFWSLSVVVWLLLV